MAKISPPGAKNGQKDGMVGLHTPLAPRQVLLVSWMAASVAGTALAIVHTTPRAVKP